MILLLIHSERSGKPKIVVRTSPEVVVIQPVSTVGVGRKQSCQYQTQFQELIVGEGALPGIKEGLPAPKQLTMREINSNPNITLRTLPVIIRGVASNQVCQSQT